MITSQKQGTLEYLVAEGISVPHCFTTRFGGVSTGSQSSLNLAVGRGDSMENVMKTFDRTGAWNLPVVENGKYVGFVSKSKIFNSYRRVLRHYSED